MGMDDRVAVRANRNKVFDGVYRAWTICLRKGIQVVNVDAVTELWSVDLSHVDAANHTCFSMGTQTRCTRQGAAIANGV